MRLPIWSWRRTLSQLGLRVVHRPKAENFRPAHMEWLESRHLMTTNLIAASFKSDGTNFQVAYDVASDASTAFNVGVYRSADGVTADTLLQTYRVTDSAKLAVGTNQTVSFAPDFADVQSDYFLIAKLDSYGEVGETSETDNSVAYYGGVFRNSDSYVHIQGGIYSDSTSISQSTNLSVTYNGNTFNYTSAGVPGLRARLHQGNDSYYASSTTIGMWVFGGPGGDSITTSNGNDYIDGGIGSDSLSAYGGDDLLYGGFGADSGTASDWMTGGDGSDTLYGDAGDSATNGENDTLYGNAGNDTLYGGAGNDFAYGGTGSDTLYGERGRDYLWGEDDDDLLFGGQGGGFSNGNSGDGDSMYGGYGNDTLWGDSGSGDVSNGEGDYLYGDYGDDALYGQVGSDTVYGSYGNDTLWGDSGSGDLTGGVADFLSGEDGDDILHGQGGRDYLYGGNNNDTLDGGPEKDFYDASYGFDDPEIIDNWQPGFSYYGSLYSSSNTNPFNDAQYWMYGGAAGYGAYATWTFSGLSSGTYDVFVTWAPETGAAAHAPFSIWEGNLRLGSYVLDQTVNPTGDVVADRPWQLLDVHSAASSLTVRLDSATADGKAIVDAVRIAPHTPIASDIRAKRLYGDGQNAVFVYDIFNQNSSSFDVKFYRSRDGQTLDAQVGSQTVSSNLTVGLDRSVTVALDYADVPEDYYLIAVVDPANVNAESTESNNRIAMEGGIFRTSDGVVQVQGLTSGDYISTSESGSNFTLTVNGTAYVYGASSVSQVHGRTHGGSDIVLSGSKPVWLYGGSGNDFFYGGSGADRLDGGYDYDILWGYGGDDILTGGVGSAYGGYGYDTAYGGDGNDILYGDDGSNNSAVGDTDYLYGNDGNDSLYGEGGADTMYGGYGNDFADGASGRDQIYGDAGDDLLLGGYGGITGSGWSAWGYGYVYTFGYGDLVYGNDGDDVLYGDRRNTLDTNGDNDELYGGYGQDRMFGEGGSDLLSGGTDGDILNDGPGDDRYDPDYAFDFEEILDDGLNGFYTGGSYSYQATDGFNGDQFRMSGSTSYGNWTFSDVTPGSYELFATWAPDASVSTAATYTIYNNGSSLGSVTVDQQQAPGSTVVADRTWRSLGTYSFVTGNLSVRVSAASGTFLADAVRVRVNRAPQATNDSYLGGSDANSITGNVLTNDTDPDGDTLAVEAVNGWPLQVGVPVVLSTGATLTLGGNGAFTFDFSGVPAYGALSYGQSLQQTFVYTARDTKYNFSHATVTVTVNGSNHAPTVANPLSDRSVNEDTPLSINVGNVFVDSDPGDDLTLSASVASNAPFTVSVQNGYLVLAPKANQYGSALVTLTAVDENNASVSDELLITVDPVNDNPIGWTRDTIELSITQPNTSISLSNLFSDVEQSTAALTYTWSTLPEHVSASLASNNLSLNVAIDRPGDYEFVVTATDGGGLSVTSTVSLTVTNDAPTFSALWTLPWQVNEDAAGLEMTLSDWFSDPEGQTLSFGAGDVSNTALFNVSYSESTHKVSVTPAANQHGNGSFTVWAQDPWERRTSRTINLQIASVNDAPTAVGSIEDKSVDVGAANATIILAGLFQDVDISTSGDSLTYTVSSSDTSIVTVSLSGTTLTLNYSDVNAGLAEVTVTATDTHSASSSIDFDVAVNVVGVNHPPRARSDAFALSPGTTFTSPSSVLANDSDPELATLTAVLESGPSHGTLTLQSNGSFTYTPDSGFTGGDVFSYRADDGENESLPALVRLTVRANAAPTTLADSYSVAEDGRLSAGTTAGVLANDSDADGDLLRAVLETGPAHGELTLRSDGGFLYRPVADYAGVDSFTYRAADGRSNSSVTTATLTVTAVNDAPVGVADGYTLTQGGSLVRNAAQGVLSNDSDVEGSSLTATLESGPAHGDLVFHADGHFTYTPLENFSGSDRFYYRAGDGSAVSRLVPVTIQVTASSVPPLARDDEYVAFEDRTLTVAEFAGLLRNDRYSGGGLTVQLAAGPSHGVLTLDSIGSFTYAPNPNFNGSDSFTYRAVHGAEQSSVVTVRLTVLASADAPVAAADGYTVAEEGTLTINAAQGLLANDSHSDSATLTAIVLEQPAHGALMVEANGSFVYVPRANYSGADSFAYVASDGALRSDRTTVTLTVTPAADVPVAAADEYVLAQHGTLQVVVSAGVLANDTDGDGDELIAHRITNPQHGELTWHSDGSFTYVPIGGFVGSDHFTYEAQDATQASNTVTVTIGVLPFNDTLATATSVEIPVGGTTVAAEIGGEFFKNLDVDFYKVSLTAGQMLVADLLASNPDSEGERLSLLDAALQLFSASGELIVANDNAVDPTSGEFGADPFLTYVVSASGNYYLAVSAARHVDYSPNLGGTGTPAEMGDYQLHLGVNNAPVAHPDVLETTLEDSPLDIPKSALLGNDTDVEGDTLTAIVVDSPDHGELVKVSTGWRYLPAHNYFGGDSFSYRVSDGLRQSEPVVVTLNVASVNDIPVAEVDRYQAHNGVALTVSAAAGVLANDFDDNSPLTAVKVTDPTQGTLVLSSNGGFVYTPTATAIGTDRFNYRVFDGVASSSVVTVTITLNNAAPVAMSDRMTTAADTPVTFSVLANDSDPDGDALSVNIISRPAHGSVTFASDGRLNYAPDIGYTGTDSFTYQATDPGLVGSQATVNLVVTTAPVLVYDHVFQIGRNQTLTVPAGQGLLSDAYSAVGGLTAELISGPTSGSLVVNSDGSFTLTAPATGSSVSFQYRGVSGANSDEGSVTVQLVNFAPVATELYRDFDAVRDQPLVLTAAELRSVASDANGDSLSIQVYQQPNGGSWQQNADGSYTYTASASSSPERYNPSEAVFLYRVADATETSEIITLRLHINAAPEGKSDTFDVLHDRTLNGVNVLSNDRDAEGETLTVVGELSTPQNASSMSLTADGKLHLVPAAGYHGAISFTYTLSDGQNLSTATVTVNVVNTAPIVFPQTYQMSRGAPLDVQAISGLSQVTKDPDGDALTFAFSSVSAGSAVVRSDGGFTYTPPANFAGITELYYSVTDGASSSNGSVKIQVVNNKPVLLDDFYSLPHGQVFTVGVDDGLFANDVDFDSDTLVASLKDGPSHSSGFNVNANGTFTYTPQSNYVGPDSFTYQVSDGVATATATVWLEVTNSAPIAISDLYLVQARQLLTVSAADGVAANDVNDDADTLTYTQLDYLEGLTFQQANGSFTYTSPVGFVGDKKFRYRVSDGQTTSAPVEVVLRVQNTTPVGLADRYQVPHDRSLIISDPLKGVLANDVDPDVGATLTVTKVADPQRGSVTLQSNGLFTYTPHYQFVGEDAFSYTISDGVSTSGITTVTIVVGNSAPSATDDEFTLNEDTTLSGTNVQVTLNDTDDDSDSFSGVVVTQNVAHGQLTLQSNGSFSYTPNPNFFGEDSFIYSVSDSLTRSTGLVVLHVTAVNDAPVFTPAAIAAHFETPLIGSLSSSASDVDGDDLTFTVVADAAHGDLTLDPDGTFVYEPDDGYLGGDQFSVTVSDGTATSSQITVYLTVGNQAPQAKELTYFVFENHALQVPVGIGLAASNTDLDGDDLTISVTSQPNNGGVTWSPDGSFTYTPNLNFVGDDAFYYQLGDGQASSNGTVRLKVVSSPVIAQSNSFSVKHDRQLVVPSSQGVLVNDRHALGDTIAAQLVVTASHGTLTLNGDGAFAYVPDAGFVGTDSFTYKATDFNNNVSQTVPVYIAVTNNAPVARGDRYSVLHGDSLSVGADRGVLINDYDIDSDSLKVFLVSSTTHGDLDLDVDTGAFDYEPTSATPDYVGTDSFTYKVYDIASQSFSNVITVVIDITNQLPAGSTNKYRVHHGQTLTVNAGDGVLVDDYDLDRDELTVAVWGSGVSHGTLALSADGSFTYTPNVAMNGNYVGPDGFSYVIKDGAQQSLPIFVSIDVWNAVPVAVKDYYSGPHGQTVSVSAGNSLLKNDVEWDGDNLSVQVIGSLPPGITYVSPAGTFAFSPPVDAGTGNQFSGQATFSYRLFDGAQYSAIATATIDLSNRAPVAVEDFFTVKHDSGTQTFNVLTGQSATSGSSVTPPGGMFGKDFDPDLDSLKAILVRGPDSAASFTWSGSNDGTFTYRPTPGFVGQDTLEYRVQDTTGAISKSVQVTINVTNLTHFTVDDFYRINLGMDQPLTVLGLLGNDRFFDADGVTFTILTDSLVGGTIEGLGTPTGEPLSLSGANAAATVAVTLGNLEDGDFTFKPSSGNGSTPPFSGHASFKYRVSDGVSSAVGTVNIEVLKRQVVANDDQFYLKSTYASIGSNAVLQGDVSLNDIVRDFSGASVLSALKSAEKLKFMKIGDDPTRGTLDLTTDNFAKTGRFKYTPNTNGYGTDTFRYSLSDGVSTSEGTVYIYVGNQFPIARDDAGFSTVESTQVTFSLTPLLANDEDPDDDGTTTADNLTVNSIEIARPPSHGKLQRSGGSVAYTPDTGFFGDDAFFYYVVDSGGAASSLARVGLTVTLANAAPEAKPDTAVAIEDSSVSIDVLANDTDVDGPDGKYSPFTPTGYTLEVEAATPEFLEHGTAVVGSNGRITYTPNSNYFGTDKFKYRIKQTAGNAYSDWAVVSVTIAGVSDPPVQIPGVYNANETRKATDPSIANWDVTTHLTDPDGPVTVRLIEILTEPTHGRVLNVINNVGSNVNIIQYQPDPDYFGDDTFTYRVWDNDWQSVTVTGSIVVAPENDPPKVIEDAIPFSAPSSVHYDVTANDFDIDSDSWTVVSVSVWRGNGTATVEGGKYINYSRTDNEQDAVFHYVLRDSGGQFAEEYGSLYVNFMPPPDPPPVPTYCSGGEAVSSITLSAQQPAYYHPGLNIYVRRESDSTGSVTVAFGLDRHVGLIGGYGDIRMRVEACGQGEVSASGTFAGKLDLVLQGDIAEPGISAQRIIIHADDLIGNVHADDDIEFLFVDELSGDVTAGDDIYNLAAYGGITGNITAEDDILQITSFKDVSGAIRSTHGDIGGITIKGVPYYDEVADLTGSITASDGKITSITVDGDVAGGTITAKQDIVSLVVGKEINGTTTIKSEQGDVVNVSAGKSITATIRAEQGDIDDINAGKAMAVTIYAKNNIGQITAGGGLSGSVTADDGNINKVEVGGTLSASIEAAGNITKVSTSRYDIIGAISAGGNIGEVSANVNLSGMVTATAGNISSIRAGRDITKDITSGGTISSIYAGQNLSSSGGRAKIKAAVDVTKIETGSHLNADISAGRDILEVKAGYNLSTGAQTSGSSGNSTSAASSSTGIVAQRNIGTISSGGSLTGDILASTGTIGSIYAGAAWLTSATRAGSLTNARIKANGAIARVESQAFDGLGGGIIDVTIESVMAGIDNVVAAGEFKGTVIAKLDIGPVTSGAKTPGDLSGSIVSTEGAVGSVSANGGALSAEIRAKTSIGLVSARTDITKFVAAGTTLGSVTASTGDITGNLSAERSTIGNVSAGRDIRGTIIAGTSIGTITAGRNISGDNGELKIEAGAYAPSASYKRQGSIGTILVGSMQYEGGNLNATISAPQNIGDVLVLGSVSPVLAGTLSDSNGKPIYEVPARGASLAASLTEYLKAKWRTATGVQEPQLAKIDHILKGRSVGANGKITGTIEAEKLGSISAYNEIQAVIRGARIGQIWSLGDVNTEGKNGVLAWEGRGGPVTIVAWGDVGGAVNGGDITITAYGEITGDFFAEKSFVVTTWDKFDAEIDANGNVDVWAYSDLGGSVAAQGKVQQVTWATLKSVAQALGGTDVQARSIQNVTFSSPLAPIIAITWGDITGSTLFSPYVYAHAQSIETTTIHAIDADIFADKTIRGGSITTYGGLKGFVEFEKLALSENPFSLGNLATGASIWATTTATVTDNMVQGALDLPDSITSAREIYLKGKAFIEGASALISAAAGGFLDAMGVLWSGVTALIADPIVTIEQVEAQVQTLVADFRAKAEEFCKTVSNPEFFRKIAEQFASIASQVVKKAPDAIAEYATGWANVSVLQTVDTTMKIDGVLSISATTVTGSIDAKRVNITAWDNVNAVVSGEKEVDIYAAGTISNVVTSSEGTVKLRTPKTVTAMVSGAYAVGIETWGSLDGTVSSSKGLVALEVYGNVNTPVTAGRTVTIATWGNLVGSVTSEQGYVDIFAAGDVTGSITAGGDISIEAWGKVQGNIAGGTFVAGPNSDVSQLSEDQKPENQQFIVDVTAHGDINATIVSKHHVKLLSHNDIKGSITATGGAVSAEAVGKFSAKVVAGDSIGIFALEELKSVIETTGANADINLVTHDAADVVVIGGKNLDITADKKLKGTARLATPGGKVSLVSVGQGIVTSSGAGAETLVQFALRAPGAEVSVYSGGAAIVDVGANDSGPSAGPSKTIEVSARGDFQGTLKATDRVELFAWGRISDTTAKVTSKDGTMRVVASKDIKGTFESGASLDVSASGNVEGKYHAGQMSGAVGGDVRLSAAGAADKLDVKAKGLANVFINQTINGNAFAEGDLNVSAGGEISGSFASNGKASVDTIDGGITGDVAAGKDASVFAATSIKGAIEAGAVSIGNANVKAMTELTASIQASGDANIAGYDKFIGGVQAGSNVTLFAGEIEGRVKAVLGTATLNATGGINADVVAGTDALVSTLVKLEGDVSGGRNAEVFGKTGIEGNITAASGNADVTSGADLRGKVTAGTDITVLVAKNVDGELTAGGNADVTIGGNASDTISADDNLTLSIGGNLEGDAVAGHDVTAAIVGEQSGEISAGNDLTVIVGGESSGTISGGRKVSVLAHSNRSGTTTSSNSGGPSTSTEAVVDLLVVGDLTGNVSGFSGVSATAWGAMRNTVSSTNGGVDVFSGGDMEVTLNSLAEANAVSLGETKVTADAETVNISSRGDLQATITADDDVGIAAYTSAEVEINAGGTASITSVGELSGEINADFAFITALNDVHAEVNTVQDAAVTTLGSAAGLSISSGGEIALVVMGDALGITLAGDDGVSALVSGKLRGDINSDAGSVSIFALDSAWLTGTAGLDYSLTSAQDVQADIQAGLELTAFGGRDVTGNFDADGNSFVGAGRNLVVAATALLDVQVVALGGLTASVSAGRDAFVAGYSSVAALVYAGRNVPLIWARGLLSGDVHAVGVVEQITGYSDVVLFVDAEEIRRVEAWGDIDGDYRASVSLGLLRSGNEVLATYYAPNTPSIVEHDFTIFTDYPETPPIEFDALIAQLKEIRRELLTARESLILAAENMENWLTAGRIAAERNTTPEPWNQAAVDSALAAGANQVLVALAQAKESDIRALAAARDELRGAIENSLAANYRYEQIDKQDLINLQNAADSRGSSLEALRDQRESIARIAKDAKAAEESVQTARFENAKELWPQQYRDKASSFVWDRITAMLDVVQGILDLVGFIPGVGDAVDAVNGLIYLARGKLVDAAFSAVSILSFTGIGYAGDAAKLGNLGSKLGANVGQALLRMGDDLMAGIRGVVKYTDEVYLMLRGIDKNSDAVKLSCQVGQFLRRFDIPPPMLKKLGLGGCFVGGTLVLVQPNSDIIAAVVDSNQDWQDYALPVLLVGIGIVGHEVIRQRQRKRKAADAHDELFAEFDENEQLFTISRDGH